MKMRNDKVVDGEVIVDATNEETFEVTPEEAAALLQAIAEADRGEFISAEQLLEDLRKLR